jgi:alpha-N-arabinofuranosidase
MEEFMYGSRYYPLRKPLRCFLLMLLLMLAAGCKPGLAPAGVAENILVNGGFEELQGGIPAGWQRDERSADKGEIRLARDVIAEGSQALQLFPNKRNIDSERLTAPLALGQGFQAKGFAGKRLYISGHLRAEGGTRAVLALYAHRTDGTVIGERLEQDDNTMRWQRGALEIPDDGQTRFIVVLAAAEGQAGSAWFDDLRVATTPPDAPAGAASVAETPLTAEIRIDAGRELRRIPRTLYGTNLEWVWDGGGLWDARKGRLDEEAVRLARELGVTMLRFPGGVFADFYHWKDGVGPQDARPVRPHMPGADGSRMSFGTDEALELSRQLRAPLLITANIVTGTPQEAADWVRYTRDVARKETGVPPVRYWELGNENYNSGNLPYLEQSTLSPAEYSMRVREYATAMREVDPGIRIGAISDANLGTRAPRQYDEWTRKVLEEAGDTIDYIAMHNAYAPTLAQDRGEDLRTVYKSMLAAPLLVRESLARVASRIRESAPEGREISIAVTEWGPAFHISPENRYVDHVKTLGSGLYVASVMQGFLLTPEVEIANFFKLVDPLWTGWIGKREGRFHPTAPYMAMKLYTQHFGTRLVEAETRVEGYDTQAVGWVDAVKDVPYLDVVASLGEDGSTLYLIAVNKDFERDARARIMIEGFAVAPAATAWILNGTGIDAHTGTDVLKVPGIKWARQAEDTVHPRYHEGAPDEVWLRESAVGDLSEEFDYVFPAHSVTALQLKRKR